MKQLKFVLFYLSHCLTFYKVLYRGADILILDEPTAVLTPQETEKLFDVLRKMREDGKSILIITHKLHEVLAISDRVAVLRKGEHIATVDTATTSSAALTEMMVGKKVSLNIDRPEPKNVCDRLVVKNISLTNQEGVKTLDNITFTAKSGEILGIAGIAGSGQRELLEAIAGLKDLDSGEIIFNRPKKNLPVSFYHKSLKQVKELASEGKFHYEDGKPVDFTGMKNSEIKALVNEGKILFNSDDVINLCDKTPLQIRELGVRLSFVPEDRLGMGQASIGIYSYELYHFYGVENIIRIGTAGAISKKLKLRDVVIGQGACTDGNFASQFCLPGTFAPIADFKLLETAVAASRELGIEPAVGNLISSDVFYNAANNTLDWGKMGVLAVEMEAAALYSNAAVAGKRALAICTVSDNINTGEGLAAEERQSAFTDMINIALETAVKMDGYQAG